MLDQHFHLQLDNLGQAEQATKETFKMNLPTLNVFKNESNQND